MIALNTTQEIGTQFEYLYDQNIERLSGLLSLKGLQQADAEDVSQEVWLRVWKFRQQFDGRDFFAWIHRITKNCVFDSFRKSESRRRCSELARMLERGRPHATDGLERLIAFEEVALVDKLLSESQDCFFDVLRAQLEGESAAETAARFGISENTVYSRRSRARRRLMILVRQHVESA